MVVVERKKCFAILEWTASVMAQVAPRFGRGVIISVNVSAILHVYVA